MGKFLVGLIAALAAALGLAKAVLSDEVGEGADEFDLAVVAGRRRYRLRGRPLLEGRILVVAGWAELDLRRAVPGPTGIDVHAIVIGGGLVVVANSDWEPRTLRLKQRHLLGRVSIERRSAPSAVA
jgi:hypothetical protein